MTWNVAYQQYPPIVANPAIGAAAFAGQAPTLALSSFFTTTFPNTEAHLSQGGIWVIGDNTGTNAATGPQTTGGTPGIVFGHANDGSDYIATYPNRFSTNKHFAEWTVKRINGYVAPSTQEFELLLLFTLGSGLTKGYEFDFWFTGNVLQVVRWNGLNGDYDFNAVTTVSGSWPAAGLNDGDVVRVYADASSGTPVFTAYINGVLQVTYHDTTAGKITSGSPGLGAFAQPGGGFNWAGYCAKGFSAGNW